MTTLTTFQKKIPTVEAFQFEGLSNLPALEELLEQTPEIVHHQAGVGADGTSVVTAIDVAGNTGVIELGDWMVFKDGEFVGLMTDESFQAQFEKKES